MTNTSTTESLPHLPTRSMGAFVRSAIVSEAQDKFEFELDHAEDIYNVSFGACLDNALDKYDSGAFYAVQIAGGRIVLRPFADTDR